MVDAAAQTGVVPSPLMISPKGGFVMPQKVVSSPMTPPTEQVTPTVLAKRMRQDVPVPNPYMVTPYTDGPGLTWEQLVCAKMCRFRFAWQISMCEECRVRFQQDATKVVATERGAKFTFELCDADIEGNMFLANVYAKAFPYKPKNNFQYYNNNNNYHQPSNATAPTSTTNGFANNGFTQ